MTVSLVENSADVTSLLSVQSLEEAVRAVEPAAVLIPPWLMQHVVSFEQGPGRLQLTLHDCEIRSIPRQRFEMIARDNAATLPQGMPAVDTLILLVAPEGEWLAARSQGQVLRHYWRLLFNCRVAAEVRRKLPAAIGPAVETRIERIGRSPFNEAKFVLQREQCLPADAGAVGAYIEFAATFLELHCFRPDLLPVWFPQIGEISKVVATLSADVDVDEVLRQTRLAGAGEATADVLSAGDDALMAVPMPVSHDQPRSSGAMLLPARAEHAAAVGNVVRSAILHQKDARLAPGEIITPAAIQDLNVLVDRLAAALQLSESAATRWRHSLSHVLALASEGWWNQEARLLYDLQKACVNYEREIYSVGVIEWLLELCRRPLRRPQPNQRIALICKSLRSALRRIHRVRVPAEEREELTHLLHDALHHAESRLCEALRPAIAQSLKAGDLVPRNAAERVAENKVVEELLDGLAHRGFITLSNVRDAIANNQLKFNDIPNPARFAAGDPLFRIDKQLSRSLDGVYHRGELYLRFFQRASSVLFATAIGRFITRMFLMPLLGAYIIIVGLDHTIFALSRGLAHFLTHTYDPAGYTGPDGPAEMAEKVARGFTAWHLPHLEPLLNLGPHKHLHTEWEIIGGNIAFALLALILLGVVNWAPCRRLVWREMVLLGRAVGLVFYRAPRWLFNRPVVHAFLNSRPTRLATRYLVTPSLVALVPWLVVRFHTSPRTQWTVFLSVFLFVNLLLNNPIGRSVERAFVHWLRTLWTRVTSELFANLFAGILHFFQKRMEDFDRMVYAVDEWLRFRDGQSRSSLYYKAALGFFWFYVAYFSRFALNLLVEPQVNPIKHFPVVTVSHKMILPQIELMKSMLPGRIKGLALPILFVIPGIFGFLAWELRSNWMLYRANRSRRLKPVMVGSHGESMARLLRPGFHSGTVPKIYAKLRKALHHADEQGDVAAAKAAMLKHHEALEHVAEAVARFVKRELLALLNQHAVWQHTPVMLNGVKLCTTRIAVELVCPLNGASVLIFFEQRGGWIVAGTEHPTGSRNITPEQAQLLGAALVGLYKMAGVDFVHEQIVSVFARQPISFDLTHDELIVWPGRDFEHPHVFSLHEKVTPQTQAAHNELQRLLFRPVGVEWEQWVGIWEPSEKGIAPLPPTFPSACVLPGQAIARAAVEGI
jgi:hypothetical protein